MKISTEVSITRNSRDEITLYITDKKSRVEFVELTFTLEQFALAVTGLFMSDIQGEVNKLDAIGKERIAESRKVLYPYSSYTPREEMVQWLKENCQEDGWNIDTYLGSKSSITHDESGNTLLNYRVYKYE